jgi:tetratricopeptide (TPR) repeat protein
MSVVTPQTALHELTPLLKQMIPGRPADRWLAEQLVTEVLTPSYEDRHLTDWDWRLTTFGEIPEALAMQSRPILHHWARCLYQSADLRNAPEMPTVERRLRFDTAIRYLRHALQLPKRQSREEHPSHLWNTLGVACSRLGRFLDTIDPAAAKKTWDEGWEAFRKAIDLFPSNDEAILAFSHRLLEHAGVFQAQKPAAPEDSSVDDVARAMSLLDEAEEVILQSQEPDQFKLAELKKDRTHALNWLGQDQVSAYLQTLKSSPNPELGYYCEAQLIGQYATTPAGLDLAISILDGAASVTPLGERSIRLLLSLLRRHPSGQLDFKRLLHIYEQLDQAVNSTMQPVEQFRHAVLYFQVGRVHEGDVRFRRLRELARRGDVTAPAVRELWRRTDKPTEPRATQVRVSRLISEWRAEGYVEEFGLTVPLRPRHFSPMPKVNDVVPCFIRFEFNGPLAIPKRFVTASVAEPLR